jgi:hypothetical protein
MRFLFGFGGKYYAYMTTLVDFISRPGLMDVVVDEVNVVPHDDLVNGVAYNDYETTTEIPYAINITNGKNLTLSYALTWKIDYEVKQGDNIITTEPLIFTSSNTNAVTVDNTGLCRTKSLNSTAMITIKLLNKPEVSTSVYIVVSNADHNYTVIVEGNDKLYLGETNEYTATVYNLGISTGYDVVWTIDYGGNNAIVTFINTDDNHIIKLKANNAGITGTVKLTAKYYNDQTKLFTKSIEVTSLGYW